MKLSERTIRVLENFSDINPGITIKKGKKLATVSAGLSTILAVANVDNDFPKEFSISNLNKFLALQSLFTGGPELEFQDDKVLIRGDKKVIEFFYAADTAIKAPKKLLSPPEGKVEFNLTLDDYKTLLKGATILGYDTLRIRGDGKQVFVETTKLNAGRGAGSVTYTTDVPAHTAFETVLNIKNLKMLDGSYNVRVDDAFVYFGNKELDLHYWIVKQAEE